MKHKLSVRMVGRGLSALADYLGQTAESLWSWKMQRLGLDDESRREKSRRRISGEGAARANTWSQSHPLSRPQERG